ncbi:MULTISPECIES: AMP-binding protein [Bacillaceae]|uniref:AMP-binding protein n=1 Tax=Bacillaceae TaxID=186817 RepID=UPI00115673A6
MSISPYDVASLVFTGGTTGESKRVMLTIKNVSSSIEQLFDMSYRHLDFPHKPK